MPSIFKQYNVLTSDGSVKIPETSRTLSEEEIQELDDEYKIETAPLEEEKTTKDGLDFQDFRPKPGKFTPAVMTKEELTEYYRAELDQIRYVEAQKAYTEALVKKKGELAECIKRVDTELEEMRNLQQKFAEKYAYELKYLAIEIAEKMIIQKISDNDLVLQRLVMKNVADIKNSAWVNVEVSERLVNLVEQIKREMEKTEYHRRATITPIAGPIDTCRINAEEGTVVADISVQAQNLREAYRADERK